MLAGHFISSLIMAGYLAMIIIVAGMTEETVMQN